MADPSTDPTTQSTSGTALSALISQGLPGALQQSAAGRQQVEAAATALPKRLADIQQTEKADIAGLGPVPQLSEADIKQMTSTPPQPKPTSVVEQWGSPAMLLATLGSAFTRMPLTNALNAGAGVMKAYQQRDFDGANAAYKQWKDANDTAMKLHEIQSDAYTNALKAIREGSGEERNNAIAEVRALGAAFNDQPVRDLAAAGRIDEVQSLIDYRNKNYDKMKAGAEDAETQHNLTQKLVTASTSLRAAQKGGNPDAIAEAQKNYDEAQQEATDWGKARAAAKGGKGGEESTTQATQNAKIGEARSSLQKLLDGESAEYGGYTITPEDFANADKPLMAGMAPTKEQAAIANMRKLAGTPVVKGTTAEPVPSFAPKAKAAPEAKPETKAPEPAAGQPASPDAIAVPPAYANSPDGTQLHKDGKVYEKKGNWLVPTQVTPTPAGM